jgi:nucleoside-diphosphate-sugar epimerase
MTSVLVTGSSGFLGSRVVKLALEEGFTVVGIDLRAPAQLPQGAFQFIEIDINSIYDVLQTKFDFIIHTASSLPYGGSLDNFWQNNVMAAKAVAEFTKASNSFLVEVGSSSVYGKPLTLPVDASTQLSPLDDYARSKLKAEEVVASILDVESYCVVRPRTILGSGRHGIFGIFFMLISRSYPVPLPNSGKQIIQFVHVDDLASLCLFLGSKKIGGVWPAASPEPLPLRSYLMNLVETHKLQIRIIPIPSRLFVLFGTIAYRLRLTKFTPWHFGAFPFSNFVSETWKPRGFEYKFTSTRAFEETYLSNVNKYKKSLISWIGIRLK